MDHAAQDRPSVGEAVRAEIAGLPAQVQASSLAVTAITLADRLDNAPYREVAPIARELREVLTAVREQARLNVPKEADPLAQIRARRAARASRSTG